MDRLVVAVFRGILAYCVVLRLFTKEIVPSFRLLDFSSEETRTV